MEKVEVKILSQGEFNHYFEKNNHRFNSRSFNELNRQKVDDLFFLGFEKNNKTRIGICLGIRDNVAYSPFSSPFGGFCLTRSSLSIEHFDDSVKGLLAFIKQNKINSVRITLPPEIYTESSSTKQLSALTRAGFTISSVELNHFFDLNSFGDGYTDRLSSDARRDLKIAQKNELEFIICSTVQEKQLAYDTIARNKRENGYPLHLSFQDLEATSEIIQVDYYLVKDKFGNINASAIMFHSTQNIVQVIYWGDLHEFRSNRSMNFLAFELFKYYSGRKEYLDIGPSTEKGIPNVGLCNFKENIGCQVTPKFVLEWRS